MITDVAGAKMAKGWRKKPGTPPISVYFLKNVSFPLMVSLLGEKV
jgi:hypothetical protein